MHPRQVIAVALALAAALPLMAARALEVTTNTNDRASNAALIRHLAAARAGQLAEVATLQAQVDAILACTFKGKVYTPGQSGADAQGCTDIEVTVN